MTGFTEDKTRDTDFRVLRPKDSANKGTSSPDDAPKKGRRRVILWSVLGILIVLLTGIILLFAPEKTPKTEEIADEGLRYIYEPSSESGTAQKASPDLISQIQDTTGKAFTEHLTRSVNDIALEIYIPHGAKAELGVGTPDITDKSIILAAQAADIRADNGKIVGAFVLRGKPLAWGLSKKGYVAIIEDKISVGVAENSPLFEEATEKGGYFFRQYPLVSQGRAIDNVLKGKSIRKSICERNGEIMVIMSAEPESFHDFAQALADLGVDNAVYLVGSEYSFGFYRSEDGRLMQFSQKIRGGQKYENYLIWRR